jgi:beta-D-xylosidase 4
MGASWNRSLWTAVGEAVSDEVRGLYSQGSSIGWESALFLWAPNVNPFRDPRWGRGQEVVSEEPLLCAEYAAHYIPALQVSIDTV